MHILLTGAGGYLGRNMIEPFERRGHRLRLMDVRAFDSTHEVVVGDVSDLAAARAAVAGVDAVIIAHMAPRSPDSYAEPPICFRINVTGTANLFHAAVEQGVRRVVLISSTGAISGNPPPRMHDAPLRGDDLYSLTKCLQEVIAEQYARVHGIAVAVLRPAYVMDGRTMTDKYGNKREHFSSHYSDCRDIGEAACLCLERDDIAFETLNCLSTKEAMHSFDVAYTCRRIGWHPACDFSWLPDKR